MWNRLLIWLGRRDPWTDNDMRQALEDIIYDISPTETPFMKKVREQEERSDW